MGSTFTSSTFVREHEDALPLIVTHGWPGSIIEQLKIIDPTDQSHGTWRERIGRVPCGDSVDAGLRVLGQADEHRLGPRAHGPSLGRADEAPRLHPLRRPGRRLGRVRRRSDGLAGTSGIARHPHQHACHRSSRRRQGPPGRRPAAIRSLRRGTPRLRAAGQNVQASRLRQVHGGAPANLVRHRGFTRRPGRLAARPQ